MSQRSCVVIVLLSKLIVFDSGVKWSLELLLRSSHFHYLERNVLVNLQSNRVAIDLFVKCISYFM